MGQAMKQRHLIAARAVGLLLAASPLLVTAPAWAGPCVTASVATYEASGFSCSVGPVTFSNIVVTTPISGSGTVALGEFSAFYQWPGKRLVVELLGEHGHNRQ